MQAPSQITGTRLPEKTNAETKSVGARQDRSRGALARKNETLDALAVLRTKEKGRVLHQTRHGSKNRSAEACSCLMMMKTENHEKVCAAL
jgi:hypothetical protein